MSSGSKGKFILKEFVFKSSKPQNSLIKPPDKHDSYDVDDPMSVIKKLPSTKEQSIIPEPIIPEPIIPEPIIPEPIIPEPIIPEPIIPEPIIPEPIIPEPIIPEPIIPEPIIPEPIIPEPIISEPIISDPKENVCLDNCNTVPKMAIKEEDNYMISITLMKIIGFFQLINTQTKKFYGINIIKLVLIFEMILSCGFFCLIVIIISYFLNEWNDIINALSYIQYLICLFLSTYKLYRVIKRSDLIWECIKLTNTNNFFYQFHDCQILRIGEMRAKKFAILIICLWSGSALLWILEPLIMNNEDFKVKHGDKIYHFRKNIFNFVYPGTENFYNEYFSFFYIFEVCLVLLWTHAIIFYEFFIISLSIVMTFQIKTIGHSYTNFSNSHEHIINNEEISLKQKEELLINDLKILIEDHQYVMRSTKSFLRVFNTDTFLQAFVTSTFTLLSWSLTIMNYYNDDDPLLNTFNFKIVLSPFFFIYYFFLYCYLFDKLSEEKDALHFAMYCTDWEKRSVPFGKLISLDMAIDECNHMNIRLTAKKTINLVMFASVVNLNYNVITALLNTIRKPKE